MNKDQVKEVIAAVLEAQLGVNPDLVLAGKSFTELEKNFDSLMFLETQMLIEEKLGIQLDDELLRSAKKMPSNADELADLLLVQLAVAD